MAAGDLGRAHAGGGGLVERVAHGLARRLARRRGAAEVLRAPARAASGCVSTVVSSRPATSSCESPSSALITSTWRWRSGRRWMSPISARASARRASSSGSCAASAGMPSSSTSPTARVRPRRSSSTHALCDEPQQPGARLERDDATAQRGVHAQEDVLQHVVGFVARGVQQSGRLAAQRRAVAFEHDRERLLVACGEAREEGAVLFWSGDGGDQGSGRPASMGQTFRLRLCVVSSSFLTDLLGRNLRPDASRTARGPRAAYERARPRSSEHVPRDGPARARSRAAPPAPRAPRSSSARRSRSSASSSSPSTPARRRRGSTT